MKIKMIKTYKLHNNEHIEFMTDVKNLIETTGARYLNVDDIYERFLDLYQKEYAIVNKESKTHCSKILEDSDAKRDDYHRAIELIIKANLRHPDEDMRNNAKMLQQIFDKYGDLRPLPYDEETLALKKFCSDMEEQKELLAEFHLDEWVDILKKENDQFEEFFEKYQTSFENRRVSLKSIRSNIDQLYKKLISKIEAFAIVNGDWKYHSFVDQLNGAIEKMQNQLNRGDNNDNFNASNTKQQGAISPETFY
ncbi:hypothetical protein D0T53_02035 [Dysgonomonas sp. 216]|uniref:DUF6261 family protein n=1 Tax=Dysgonomonas sp. 216 TaxID=2302934 RepID=UPI0013D13CA5|nr:DUF6261 family protein [Dysgonomonas sp. 216]NDW17694.1 hypothetical protein [Dysgonomonas sp. 216]